MTSLDLSVTAHQHFLRITLTLASIDNDLAYLSNLNLNIPCLITLFERFKSYGFPVARSFLTIYIEVS